jgi:hypothetical protein
MGKIVYLPKRTAAADHLLKIVLKTLDLSGITLGEQEFYQRLGAELNEVLQKSLVVDSYEGFSVGYGECVFWIYTSDLEQTAREILPVFRGRFFGPGSYYVKVDKNRKIWDVVSLG